MQHGASPYGAPPPEPAPLHRAEAASPIRARPPPAAPAAGFEDPGPSAAHGSFPDEDFGERGAATGNRWPRQETLALLQIRSDMDAAFRDATLKGPLWEDVSRKLGEQGYRRSGKKCKEKFENVLKYYKRTKEGRGGRQDGKSYRFFDQLQALNPPAAATATAAVSASIPVPTPNPPPAPVGFGSMAGAAGSAKPGPIPAAAPPPVAASAGISFSSDTSSLQESETEGEEEGGLQGRKRKHSGDGGGGSGRKMMAFFDGMMRQVLERQDAMQQRFLEAIERREQDRMVREEAWRRQEIARLAREQELLAQERAAAASRDAAIIAFLQKITGQTIQVPPPPAASVMTPPPPPPPQLSQPQPQQIQREQQQQPVPPPQPPRQQSTPEVVRHHKPPTSTALVPVPEPHDVARGASFEPASSRWPKAEVHALINLRSSLEAKYQEAGPKGPLWEEISAEMGRLGHNRSAKRCKEKWENINKYFKKVKESSKKRPEDAKTCPYFHQLDALYRRKLSSTGVSGSIVTQRQQPQETSPNPQETGQPLAIMAPPPPVHQPIDNSHGNGGSAAVAAGPTNGGATMKPEDIVKEQEEPNTYGADGDYDDDDDDDDGDDEASKMQYRVQFQRPNTSGGGGPAPSTTGPFLALYSSSGNP